MPGAITLLAPIHSARQHPGQRIHAATALTITFKVRQPNGQTALSLSGLTPVMRVRRDLRDATNLWQSDDGTVTDAAGGLCTIALPASAITAAGIYWAELALKESGGDEVYQVAYRLDVQAGAGAA